MFSNPEIANFINRNFECSWESVRDVPTVTIDFGKGKTLKRTLNGNIATYVCTDDGRILDVLPGVYEPGAYKDRLQQLELLHKYFTDLSPDNKTRMLIAYHQTQQSLLKQGKAPARFMQIGSGTEKSIELVQSKEPVAKWTKPISESEALAAVPLPKADLAQWKKLTDDVRFNETKMREAIHSRLSMAPRLRPKNVTRWLYREVLHADLDDPYLGLEPVLFSSYPFDSTSRSN